MQLSLPLSDRNLSGRGTIMTPLGPRDLAWAERVSRGEGGEDFFPWWESGRGVRSMVGELNAELWVRTPMRSPLTDAEKAQLQSIFKRSSAIVKLGGADYLPWRTLADLAADSEYAREFGERAATSIDRHSPIGYLRGDATFSFGRWTLRFSASATNPCPEEPEVDERSARYADNTHMIWTLVVDPPEGVHSADDMRARSYYSGLDGNVRWSGDGFEANARSLTLPLNDPELPEYHKLDAQFFGSGHAMILIIDSLHASGRDRAMEIAQSVRLKAAPNER